MASKAWMPLYIGDYLRDTAHLNATASGAYLHLIMHYWQTGGLPNDDAELARIARLTPKQYAKMRPSMAAFFQPGWRHKRIDRELQRAAETSEKRSRAGAIGNARKSQMRAQMRSPGVPQSHKKIRNSEYEAAREASEGQKADDRASKPDLAPSAELREIMARKRPLQ